MKKVWLLFGCVPVAMICLSRLFADWLTIYFTVLFVGFVSLAFVYAVGYGRLQGEVKTKHDDTGLTLNALERFIKRQEPCEEWLRKIENVKIYSRALGVYFISGILSFILTLWVFSI